MNRYKKLTIFALVVGLIGALVAIGGVASGSVSGAKLDLVMNASGDRFVLIEDGAITKTQTLSTQACRVSSSGDELVELSATANPNNPVPGLKDHVMGVKAQGEGNGTPCTRIDGNSSGRGENLRIEFAGLTIGSWYAEYARFGVKLKFGATGKIQAFKDGVAVGTAATYVCEGSDCGPDSGNDRRLFELPVGSESYLFDAVEISVEAPSDGAVSLLDDPLYDTYFMLATDDVAPEIAVLGDDPATAEAGQPYSDAGATAVDDVDGPVSVTVSNPVNTEVLGTYTVTYSAEDAAGNVATADREVTVVDTLPPAITLTGPNPQTLEADKDTPYVEPGVSASDSFEGIVAVTTTGSVDTGLAASYELTYTASDMSGNTATETRTVNVVDTTDPEITLLGDNPLSQVLGDPFEDPGYEVSDNSSGTLTVSVDSSALVNPAGPGDYPVIYTVTDPEDSICYKDGDAVRRRSQLRRYGNHRWRGQRPWLVHPD